jgi:hypothetical protein
LEAPTSSFFRQLVAAAMRRVEISAMLYCAGAWEKWSEATKISNHGKKNQTAIGRAKSCLGIIENVRQKDFCSSFWGYFFIFFDRSDGGAAVGWGGYWVGG